MYLLDEITTIFKREKGFDRLFSLFIKKYKSYERVEKGISVIVNNPTEEEKQAISGLIGKDYSKNKSIQLSAERMERAILKTKYGKMLDSISFQEIVERYNGEPLVSYREAEAVFLAKRADYFARFQKEASSSLFVELMEWIKAAGNNRFYQWYNQDKANLTKSLKYLDKALALLPLPEHEYLPVFASNATGNPHAFDASEPAGKLFIYALQIIRSFDSDWEIRELNAEQTAQLLDHFKIMKDDLLNFVSVFNVTGTNKDGKQNFLLQGAAQEKAFFHLPLKEVVKLDRVDAASRKKRIFVIENSSVASHVVNELVKHNINETIISGNGQFKLATLKFLDAYVANSGVIYYSGDFDPEGIGMAIKLRKRYGSKLKYWNYDVGSYRKSLSNEPISEKRLNQLNNINDPFFQSLIEEIKKVKRSGYQEKLLVRITEEFLLGKWD
ncbi:TIGR02679 domain-containing protein [Virgibacillus sp. W0181]|uniref:TIGR02679 domain-containing protein n=1 Tax=Virgibacillus sp. W0181 TaxID=3391581 RepID=UPI003F479BE3